MVRGSLIVGVRTEFQQFLLLTPRHLLPDTPRPLTFADIRTVKERSLPQCESSISLCRSFEAACTTFGYLLFESDKVEAELFTNSQVNRLFCSIGWRGILALHTIWL